MQDTVHFQQYPPFQATNFRGKLNSLHGFFRANYQDMLILPMWKRPSP
jgi:hypothetical protein